MLRQAAVRRGWAWFRSRHGRVRHGTARLGKVRLVEPGRGEVGQARAGRGMAGKLIDFPEGTGRTMAKTATVIRQADPTNDGAATIEQQQPFSVKVTVEGTRPFLFHRWSCDAVAEKAAANKGSRKKKEDDVESYVYRDERGVLCIPSLYFVRSIIGAAKFRQDPRSPRKSAMDLFTAGVLEENELCPLEGNPKTWEYLDRRRVLVQRNGITRLRPAFAKGWRCTTELAVTLPEYITEGFLREIMVDSGRFVGVGNFRPTFGRFSIVGWTRITG